MMAATLAWALAGILACEDDCERAMVKERLYRI